eukprot:evm.model.scf_1298.5 EVM.evm.TU.scf_1298.5   scf_1298:35585-37951(+)
MRAVEDRGGEIGGADGAVAIGGLFARLRGLLAVKGVRSHAASLAGRVLQVMGERIKNAAGEGEWGACLEAIVCVVRSLPAAWPKGTADVSGAVLGKITAPDATDSQRAAAAQLLAGMSEGAKDAAGRWGESMRTILVMAHGALDRIYGGWEAGDAGKRALKALRGVGPGDVSGATGLEKVAEGMEFGEGSLRPALQVFGGLVDCLERQMTVSTATYLAIPCAQIWALAARVLSVNATAIRGHFSASPMSLELLAALPSLHGAAWDLVGLLIKVARSQLLPLSGSISRSMKEGLYRIHRSPAVGAILASSLERAALYRAAAQHVRCGGLSSARTLLTDSVPCLEMEFNLLYARNWSTSGLRQPSTRSKGKRRRKDEEMDHEDIMALNFDLAVQQQSSGRRCKGELPQGAAGGSVETAAECVRLLTALMITSGSNLADVQRVELDSLIGSLASQQLQMGQGSSSLTVAVLELVLHSVHSPCHFRPALLPMVVRMLQEAPRHPSLDVRLHCFHAGQGLEALLHPRAVPCGPAVPACAQRHASGLGTAQGSFPRQMHVEQAPPVRHLEQIERSTPDVEVAQPLSLSMEGGESVADLVDGGAPSANHEGAMVTNESMEPPVFEDGSSDQRNKRRKSEEPVPDASQCVPETMAAVSDQNVSAFRAALFGEGAGVGMARMNGRPPEAGQTSDAHLQTPKRDPNSQGRREVTIQEDRDPKSWPSAKKRDGCLSDSDSEGPLPEIDSGFSSEEDSDEDRNTLEGIVDSEDIRQEDNSVLSNDSDKGAEPWGTKKEGE